ncbi:MAG TPA: relaxase/mobilization nuclease domain-containing protein [Candidatus Helicobacter avicola]|nr:relaxase/mobilization nuclease domain-containing protein [Candidatus Helicobacter avicola]
MREIIVDIPLEKQAFDEKLFEYKSFRKAPRVREVYLKKVQATFSHNFVSNAPTFKPQGSKKNIVIKNIGNMKKAHLKNALSYTIEKSFQEYIDLFGQGEENSLQSVLSEGERCGIDYLGNFVSVEEILADWQKDFSANPNTNEALHLVFSLNELKSDSLIDILLESTKATMQSNFSQYKYVLIPHAHQNQPHIHIIVNKTNIFSRKKLHFNSKQECASFYDGLREDFRQNLFVLSNGKLDYTNDVRFDKAFRQEHLDSKIKALEGFEDSPQGYESDIEFLQSYKSAIVSVNAKLKFFTTQDHSLQKEIRNKAIYLHNVEKKIQSLEAEHKNPSKLKEKRLELIAALSHLKKNYEKNERAKSVLSEHIKRFLDWEDTYKSFSKNFTLHNKKKSLVSTFKGYEQYLPTNLVQKLNNYKRDVEKFESTLAQNTDTINEGIIAGVMDYNDKTNVFKLSKKLSKLTYYTNIISSIAFPENKSLQERKDTRVQELEQSLEVLLAQIAKRMRFVFETLQDFKQKYENYKRTLPLNPDNELIPDKMLFSLQKRVDFLSKELNVGKEILHKHAFPIPRFSDDSTQSTFATPQGDVLAQESQEQNMSKTPKDYTNKTTQTKSVKHTLT